MKNATLVNHPLGNDTISKNITTSNIYSVLHYTQCYSRTIIREHQFSKFQPQLT